MKGVEQSTRDTSPVRRREARVTPPTHRAMPRQTLWCTVAPRHRARCHCAPNHIAPSRGTTRVVAGCPRSPVREITGVPAAPGRMHDTSLPRHFTMPALSASPAPSVQRLTSRLLLGVAVTLAAREAPAQWTPLHSGTTASLRGLSVVDSRTVWASGSKGTVVHSTDGGATWSLDTIPGAAAFDLRSVHARSPRVAHVAATAGRIWRTTDGGRTWSLRYQASDTTVFLDAIDFWDDQHGMALGDPIGGRFFLLVTNDGGETWRVSRPSNSAPSRHRAKRPLPPAGVRCSCRAGATRWSRGDWNRRRRGAPAPQHQPRPRVDRVRHADPLGGIVGGDLLGRRDPGQGLMVVGGHYAQDDSTRANAAATLNGTQWRLITPNPPAGYRSGVAFFLSSRGSPVGIAVGPKGSDISRNGGMQWTPFDGVGYHAVRAARDGIFFASGSGGRIARFDARALR